MIQIEGVGRCFISYHRERDFDSNIKFKPHGGVVALWTKLLEANSVAYAFAFCHPKDVFCKMTGRETAAIWLRAMLSEHRSGDVKQIKPWTANIVTARSIIADTKVVPMLFHPKAEIVGYLESVKVGDISNRALVSWIQSKVAEAAAERDVEHHAKYHPDSRSMQP